MKRWRSPQPSRDVEVGRRDGHQLEEAIVRPCRCDVVDAGLMKQPCGDAGMPAPCNPWGGDVGDYLSFKMPDSCSACRDDDPKKLSLAQQSDDVSSAGRQP